MSFDKEREFDESMSALIELLKKIIKNLPFNKGPFPKFPASSKDSGVNFNLYFFNFLPVLPEELEELEEAYEEALFQDDKKEDLSSELNAEDLDFLRRHGIRFNE